MMKILTLCFVFLLQFAVFETGHCKLLPLKEENGEEEEGLMINMESKLLGGVNDHCKGSQNDAVETQNIGRFAVEEHNKKENSLLEFVRVVKANEQVVAGKLYHLTLEAIEAGKKQQYEAKVWVKPWMNSKQLQEFKRLSDAPSFGPSDLDVK